MKTLKKLIVAIAIVCGIAAILWGIGEHQSYKFDDSIAGKDFTILHETYLRDEPVKNSEKYDLLEVGSVVRATGAISERWCPSTTCSCGGSATWLQVVDGNFEYWIMEEAIQ